MRSIDPVLLTVFSDLFVNLSAGWLGAAFIVPMISKRPKINFLMLTANLLLGIVSLAFAFELKKLAGL